MYHMKQIITEIGQHFISGQKNSFNLITIITRPQIINP